MRRPWRVSRPPRTSTGSSHARVSQPLWVCKSAAADVEEEHGRRVSAPAARTPLASMVGQPRRAASGGACRAVLHSCVRLPGPGATSPGGGRYREPARPVRAVGGVRCPRARAVDGAPLGAAGDLLVFADNRQDAAFQAGWMRDHARALPTRGRCWLAARSARGQAHDRGRRSPRPGRGASSPGPERCPGRCCPRSGRSSPFRRDAGAKHREERALLPASAACSARWRPACQAAAGPRALGPAEGRPTRASTAELPFCPDAGRPRLGDERRCSSGSRGCSSAARPPCGGHVFC